MALVDFHMKGCGSCLYHVYQRKYVAMHEIDLDGEERNICHNCVDKLWMEGKPDKLKKVQHSTMYRTEELEKDE